MWFIHDRKSAWSFIGSENFHDEPRQVKAGDKFDMRVEAYWAPQDLVPHDYSVVVWATVAHVTLTVEHGQQSEHFPNYKLSDNVTLYGRDGRVITSSDSVKEEEKDEEPIDETPDPEPEPTY